MKKSVFVVLVLLVMAGLFLGGVLTGKAVYENPTREILVGTTDEEEEVTTFHQTYTDIEDQTVVDNLQQILLFSEQVEESEENIEGGRSDVLFQVNSPKSFASLHSVKVWFEEDHSILKLRDDDIRKVGKEDTNYLKEVLSEK
ncbi:hypothetical protein [Alteribacter aurantiacus]|uniref:hypothetical protein n=1 Tax=Alteribacter aurantiacus TaxID=254410 RepID=UPI0003F58586|nr:hypothetical protein [Alteribacter aurantiacus]